MGEIAASRDMVASAVLYTRLANMGLGVLREHASLLTNHNKTSLRRDVASACLAGLHRYMEGGAYKNLAVLLGICEQVYWFSDQEKCVISTGSSWSFSRETRRAWSLKRKTG